MSNQCSSIVQWQTKLASRILTLLVARIHTGELPGKRFLPCAVIASKSDLLRLQYYVGLLAIDWRDVIVAGEYAVREQALAKVRNFCEPLPPDDL